MHLHGMFMLRVFLAQDQVRLHDLGRLLPFFYNEMYILTSKKTYLQVIYQNHII